MEYKKPFAAIFFIALALAYLNLGRVRTYPQQPKVLGTATTSTASGLNATASPETIIDSINAKYQDLETKNADLQSALNRANFLLAFPRNLKRGMSGADVKLLQEQLNQSQLAGNEIPANGHFTKTTETALKIFQTGQELKPSGIFDQATKEKLADAVLEGTLAEPADLSDELQNLVDSQQALDQNSFSAPDLAAAAPTTSDTSLLTNDSGNQDMCPPTDVSTQDPSLLDILAPAPAPSPNPTPTPAPSPATKPAPTKTSPPPPAPKTPPSPPPKTSPPPSPPPKTATSTQTTTHH